MAADMFLKLSEIEGESVDKTHTNEIDVLAISLGMSQTGSGGVGGGSGTGKVSMQDITISKYVDKASAKLALKCAEGKHIDEGVFVARKAGGDNPLEYMKITMNQVLVSSISHAGAGGGEKLSEVLTLNFGKIKIEYFIQDEKGIGKPAGEMTWDVRTNAK